MTRIAVFAYSDTGHACLKRLLDRGENVVARRRRTRTHPEEAIWFPSVAELARSRGDRARASWTDPPTRALVARVRAAAPDLLFSFYYRAHPSATRCSQIPRLGAFNMHGSLLPKYRGRAPVNWAVAERRDARRARRSTT